MKQPGSCSVDALPLSSNHKDKQRINRSDNEDDDNLARAIAMSMETMDDDEKRRKVSFVAGEYDKDEEHMEIQRVSQIW